MAMALSSVGLAFIIRDYHTSIRRRHETFPESPSHIQEPRRGVPTNYGIGGVWSRIGRFPCNCFGIFRDQRLV